LHYGCINFSPIQKNPATITYELNGGTNDTENPHFYNVESGEIALKTPTRSDKYFAGWKDNFDQQRGTICCQRYVSDNRRD
jgi:hypothetical protein